MNSATPTLKHCQCSTPVMTDRTFCDECGIAFHDSPYGADDVLGAGQTVDAYSVSARTAMWAELKGADGTLYRFWPTGSTRPTAPDEPAPVHNLTPSSTGPEHLNDTAARAQHAEGQPLEADAIEENTSPASLGSPTSTSFPEPVGGSFLAGEPDLPIMANRREHPMTQSPAPSNLSSAEPSMGNHTSGDPTGSDGPTGADVPDMIVHPSTGPSQGFVSLSAETHTSSEPTSAIDVLGREEKGGTVDALPYVSDTSSPQHAETSRSRGDAGEHDVPSVEDEAERADTAATTAINATEALPAELRQGHEDAPERDVPAVATGLESTAGGVADRSDTTGEVPAEGHHVSARTPAAETVPAPADVEYPAQRSGDCAVHQAEPSPVEAGITDDPADISLAVDAVPDADMNPPITVSEGVPAVGSDQDELGVALGADEPAEAPVSQVEHVTLTTQDRGGLTEAPKHHAFIPFTPTVLGGVPGRLEPARPRLFSGREARPLRDVLHAEPEVASSMPGRVLGWLVQCAQAMKSAHENGILVNSFTLDTVFLDFSPGTDRPERIAISTALFAAPFAEAQPVAGYSPLVWNTPGPGADVYQVGALLRDLLGLRLDINGDPQDEQTLFDKPMPLVRLALRLMSPDAAARPVDADALKRALVEAQQALEAQHSIDVAGWTDVGLRREHNEDAYGFLQYEEQAGKGSLSTTLLVVCDGVGGANAGEEASRLAVREILSTITASSSTGTSVPERLEQAILQANHSILNIQQEHRGAGCTVVAVYIQGRQYWVAHAGDSRAYKCVDGKISVLTADHSWTAQQVRKGLMTPSEAHAHENAHMIYRSLGERERLEVEIQPPTPTGFPLEPRTRFLLCSDGVTDVLSDSELAVLLSTVDRPVRHLARQCVDHANAAGGPDNITALVAAEEIRP